MGHLLQPDWASCYQSTLHGCHGKFWEKHTSVAKAATVPKNLCTYWNVSTVLLCLNWFKKLIPSSSSATNVTLSGTKPKGECGVPFNYRFPMPKSAIDQPWSVLHCSYCKMFTFDLAYFVFSICRYSFSYGKAHFIVMSTEHDFERDSNQYKAIRKSLKKVDRSVTPWVIVGGHR